MITPHGENTIELHHHWEEIILATLKDIKFGGGEQEWRIIICM